MLYCYNVNTDVSTFIFAVIVVEREEVNYIKPPAPRRTILM